jgi:hypothetical protein
MGVFKIPTSCEESEFEVRDDGRRYCNWCGSLHPEDLANLIEKREARMHGADWKYGWPHKFYVDVKNPTPDKEVLKSYCSYVDESGVRQIGQEEYGPQGEWLYAKFYSNHLQMLDDETFNKVAPIISEACGIKWVKDEKGLKYCAPYHNYQKD